MNPGNRPLNKEETDLLPFDFLNTYYAAPDSTNTSYYFARWHGHLAYSIDLNRGWCYEDDDTDVTLDHWKTTTPVFDTSTTAELPHTFAAPTTEDLSVGPVPKTIGNT